MSFFTSLSRDTPKKKCLVRWYVSSVPVASVNLRNVVENRWKDFFANPYQWWDNRFEKINPKFPDFKHKKTQEALWLVDKWNPPWVEAKLAAIKPGSLQVDLFTWNKRLARHAKAKHYKKTMEVFQNLQREGMAPDKFTFIPVLNACANLRDLEEGRRIHRQIMRSGFESDVYVGNCLVDMYAKCGSIEEASRVFNNMPDRDLISWNSMILGCVKCEKGQTALKLFQQMQRESVKPDSVTFVGLLNACASVEALEEGRRVHEHVIRTGCESNRFVGNSLVDMYAKCGRMEDAWEVFTKMPVKDVVAWSAVIVGYSKSGQGQRALELSWQMHRDGVDADAAILVGVLNACASVAALEEGRRVHGQVIQGGCESNVIVGNSLINMYAKCGSIEDARRVFTNMSMRDVISWTTMLAGYAMHGHGKEALRHFELMCQEGVEMDEITFVSLLLACTHGGLVDEGLHYFESPNSGKCVSLTVKHYACMVDLLGRAGRLHEAQDLIGMMSFKPNSTVWMCLLGACRIHGNMDMGARVAERVLELQPQHAAGYVLLSNIYAATGKEGCSPNVTLAGTGSIED